MASGSSNKCIRKGDCANNGFCINGRCRTEGFARHQRCHSDPQCVTGLKCLSGFCMIEGEKKSDPCQRDADCHDNRACVLDKKSNKRTCRERESKINSECGESAKCNDELTCYGGKCRERCLLQRNDGCTTEGDVCRDVGSKFPHYQLCLPKSMSLIVDPTPPKEEPTPSIDDPLAHLSGQPQTDYGFAANKAIYLTGGASLFVILVLVFLILWLVRRRRTEGDFLETE